jgi:hypothetical protein
VLFDHSHHAPLFLAKSECVGGVAPPAAERMNFRQNNPATTRKQKVEVKTTGFEFPVLNLLASDFIVDSEIKKKARYGLEPSGCSVEQRGPAVSAAACVTQERTQSSDMQRQR